MKRLLHGEVAVGESLPRLTMDMHTTRIVARPGFSASNIT